MFDFLGNIFRQLVYNPQLNLLQLYYNLTNDVGLAIILVAITVNLLLWPVMVSSYLSGQKMRLLNPQIRNIQNKYKPAKDAPASELLETSKKMRDEIGTLQKKHGIKTGVFFQVIFLQIFFASGVFYVVNDVSKAVQNKTSVEGLYTWLFGRTAATFPDTAFGFMKLAESSTNYLWLPIASLILSFLYGKYSLKWAPNAQLPTSAKKVVEDKKVESDLPFDPESFAKNQEFLIIYVLPIFSFILNSSWSAGLNLYFATLSLFNLVRQMIISQYYASHVDKLIKDIAESDPALEEEKQDFTDVDIVEEATQPVATPVVKLKLKPKKKAKIK
jgi:YidC/Oxa1 family membrane protein insertase